VVLLCSLVTTPKAKMMEINEQREYIKIVSFYLRCKRRGPLPTGSLCPPRKNPLLDNAEGLLCYCGANQRTSAGPARTRKSPFPRCSGAGRRDQYDSDRLMQPCVEGYPHLYDSDAGIYACLAELIHEATSQASSYLQVLLVDQASFTAKPSGHT
jgi:hypothetical protein